MKQTIVKALVVASVLSQAVAFAQTTKTKPTTATYIMKDEIDQVSKSEQSRAVVDENTKVIDPGYENFTVGVIHRASTRNPAPSAPARDIAGAAAAPAQTCGRKMDTLPPAGHRQGSFTTSKPRVTTSSPTAERCSRTATSLTDGKATVPLRAGRTGRGAVVCLMT
jgi:hypothetical protein